jgi:hypothetical protein
MLFTGVVDAAKNTAGIDLLTDFDLENDADRGIDGVFFRVAPGQPISDNVNDDNPGWPRFAPCLTRCG